MRARLDDVTWRNVDGQIVILDLRDSSYLRTNPTGTLLWERLQDECTVEELVSLVVDSFGVERTVAEADVGKFVESLAASDLLADPV